jgi:hypothetical protein
MILLELFDRPFDWTLEERPAGWEASFKTDKGLPYKVVISEYPNGGVNLEFWQEKSNDDTPLMKITGTGDAAQIFTTVMQIMHEYVIENDPPYIQFSASRSEPSRIRLYAKMASSLLPGGYSIESQDGNFFINKDQ